MKDEDKRNRTRIDIKNKRMANIRMNDARSILCYIHEKLSLERFIFADNLVRTQIAYLWYQNVLYFGQQIANLVPQRPKNKSHIMSSKIETQK